jgi:hypothetical protein
MNARTLFKTASLFAAFALMAPARGAELDLPRDGWASWEITAVEDAPAWCCWKTWKRDVPGTTCMLDDEGHGFGSRDNQTTTSMRLYARLVNGKVERLRTLASSCPVEAKTPIKDLGVVASDDSARWVLELVQQERKGPRQQEKHGNEALGALAIHPGSLAFDTLSSIARTDDLAERRKQAIFWLALVRGPAGADLTRKFMFEDESADVRRHAAFASTISKSQTIGADLIRQGNTDKAGEVRAQAWFWLANKGYPNAEESIVAALRKDKEPQVREQAIFALSRLPDERGTKALIAAAEDQTLSKEQRKRAIFWLAQSESKAAEAYLDKVLAGNVSR